MEGTDCRSKVWNFRNDREENISKGKDVDSGFDALEGNRRGRSVSDPEGIFTQTGPEGY